jgi:CHAD domain-containing protein
LQHDISYNISDKSALDKLVEHIQKKYDLEERPACDVTRIFLDSFDCRLYLGGVRLWIEQKDGVTVLWQSGIPNTAPSVRVELPKSISIAPHDLPSGSLRDKISELLEMRVLLQQVEMQSSVRTLAVLDDERKTVLRIYIEENHCRVPGDGRYVSSGSRVRLQPIRGYSEPLAKIKKIINKISGLAAAKDGLCEQAIHAVGIDVCSYSSKISFKFDSATPAVLAVRDIHLHLLKIIEANIPGVKQDLDSEFLHDLRVAVRRMRSALTQIKGVLTEEDVNRFKSRLAWIGQVTGPTRDMDVFLLEFEQYRNCLPERFRRDLDPLYEFIESHQRIEHGVMVKKINSPHFRGLVKELREFLDGLTEKNGAPEATTPIAELASKRIYKMYCQVMKDGQAIGDDSPAEHLHDLRKECKKLRYLMEFFRTVYPEKKIGRLIKSLKQLLDNLGNFQDLEVQADKLRDYASQMVEEGETPHDTLLAMGMLVDGLLTKQLQARNEFAERFAKFAKSDNQKIIRSLFAPKRKKDKG